jgi:3-phosphoglycerate kinase
VSVKIGNSLFDEAGSKIVGEIMEKAKKNNVTLHFPTDYITADKFDKDAQVTLIHLLLESPNSLFTRLALLPMTAVSQMAGW